MFSNIDDPWDHSPVVVGHQGGWDEALFVAVPLVIFFLLLRAAKRRAEAEAEAPASAEPDVGE